MRLKTMKQQTQVIVDTTVAHGVTVSAPINGYQPSRLGAATAAAPTSQQPWDENQGAIDHNNQLWNQVVTQRELLWSAARTGGCAESSVKFDDGCQMRMSVRQSSVGKPNRPSPERRQAERADIVLVTALTLVSSQL